MSAADPTQLIADLSGGHAPAAKALLPLVYDQLRELAAAHLQRERRGHTLQPTALVHEAYLKLIDQSRASFQDRSHFVAVASQAIRRLLIDHARSRNAAKRGGGALRQEAGEWLLATDGGTVDLLALDDALAKLAATQPRAAQIVEMKFFGGLTVEQIASVLNVGTATVEREWRLARAILYRELGDG